jgi:hypothetical protein
LCQLRQFRGYGSGTCAEIFPADLSASSGARLRRQPTLRRLVFFVSHPNRNFSPGVRQLSPSEPSLHFFEAILMVSVAFPASTQP